MGNPVILTNAAASGVEAREALRAQHGVRLVEPAEEGTGVDALPGGVYGFTYSPAVASPLFRTFRYRTFEVHKLASGEALILGFATPADAERFASATGTVDITIFHDAEGEATALVGIPHGRIARHRQYSVLNTPGLTLTVIAD